MSVVRWFALAFAFVLAPAAARADLPPNLSPAQPFPAILQASSEQNFVAPGVVLADYYLMTTSGPLTVHALSIDPRQPTLRVDTVLASDSLISKGETVSAMAQRTGAVAGMNGDFFDIGSTYQPIGMLVRSGIMLRSPSGRAVMAIASDRTATFSNVRFAGSVHDDDDGREWTLAAVNAWPPQGGAVLVSEILGPIPPEAGTALALLTVTGQDQYRVTDIVDANVTHDPVLALAFGPAARAQNGLPHIGDLVSVEEQLDPQLADLAGAIGGGPLLIHNGMAYDDPLPPAPAEALVAVPLSGALQQGDGTLIFVQVDGRAPQVSIGLTRPQFAALLLAFGALDGMAFDGGGSSTLVARVPGDAQATVRNAPSDGREREVADGIFVYDQTPPGQPARLALRHLPRRMLQGASAPLDVVVTDAAGHIVNVPPLLPIAVTTVPPTLAHLDANGRLVADSAAFSGTLHVEAGPLGADVPLDVVDHITTLRIEPQHPNPEPGASIALKAIAFDGAGAPIDVDGDVVWSAPDGAVTPDGTYHTGNRDGDVIATIGDRRAQTVVRVGRYDVPIPIFRNGETTAGWTFASLPAGQPGSVESNGDDLLALSYDFTGSERAAFANTDVQLQGELLSLKLDVQGDGGGEALRVAVTTADGDRLPITLARSIDWQGWRTLHVQMPREAIAPLTLDGFYLVAPRDGSKPAPAGTITLRKLSGMFAGTSTPNPPYRN
ncbi:MAG TPA: phosphodiester glycosidase family protein [Candidatus Baltobacteraceae bacterium]